MLRSKNLSKFMVAVKIKRPRIPVRLSAVKTVLRADGLVDSIVEKLSPFVDAYRDQNFRNYQVQTLIQTGSIELLNDVGTLPLSPLAGNDKLQSVSLSLSQLSDVVRDLRSRSSVSDQPAAQPATQPAAQPAASSTE